MRSLLADTGPLYALVDPGDRLHLRAQSEASRIAEERLTVVVAVPTLFESYSLVLRRLGMRASQRWLAELSAGVGLLNPHRDDYNAAAQRVQTYSEQDITLFDTLVAVLADQMGLRVWTFDHHFDVMGVDVWR